MKKLFTSIVVVAVVLISSGTFAQAKKAASVPLNEKSLLWEISGNGLSKSSYLYGTIHMICGNDYFLSDKTKKAFDATNNLVLEVNLSDPNEMSSAQQFIYGKEPLSKTLSPQQLNDLDVLLQKRTGMTVKQVDKFNLVSLTSLIMMKSFGCDDIKMYEMEFIEMAKSSSKSIAGFETLQSQMDFLSSAYTDAEMITMLQESNDENTKKMVQNYIQENLPEIYNDVTAEKAMNEKTRKVLLDGRNENWIVKMPNIMKDKSTFFAVGAGHLLGEQGVIRLLRKKGYTVKPVMN
ncbi:TraB/GumN family protein [Flavobacterium muglaense]|uniref:TraB/GumN family protein n=1 Tax=Flavobacterium muglaense TaxID=2764716 RepID=A0A923SGC9_9FLAO|nr:TraB/GumN family protein [Flavobacterium muglaense]MBC5839096.1 TraB/GumN family protein [Flavobacterium muglaense]MBC5845561.1 TraB/GumN family protein [Flavobacterium muglaense]